MKKNIILQVAYQLLGVIVPFITTPYLSRILGAEQIGVYSYTYSYIYYFTMLGMLGFVSYGSKQIASVQNDEIRRKQKFWSIYSAQLLCCIIAFVLFMLWVNLEPMIEIKNIMMCQAIYLLACFFDVNWYYFGIEKFSTTVTRNILVKIISVILIFTCVRNSKNIYMYIYIMAGAQLCNNVIIWLLTLRQEKWIRVQWNDICMGIKESFVLFIPIATMSIYHLMDKTMLGILSDDKNSGFYYSADKVINIPLCVIIGIGTVMLPRICAMISSGNKEKSQEMFIKSFNAYVCLSCSMAFGIAAISNEFVPLFFGEAYEPCIMIVAVMAIALPFKALADMFRTQYLIPNEQNNVYIFSVAIGAIINLILNYVLIKEFGLGALGATVATVLTEAVVCVLQGYRVVKTYNMHKEVVGSLAYVIYGAFMFIVVRGISVVDVNILAKVLIEICVGVGCYLLLCIVHWKVLRFLKNKLKSE